ncbi:glycosyltransferase [Massilia sp. PAMC28688]|uniref:glycosyltransferase n=1 Tax=Massilia sp. PAMC28688 TaxID=2861283 RepID=UPI001C6341B0|nr:glycosyltransferase [Massilia sp. PAMC28688]QYF93873.1 glycosyltransferase [Massilia sp. PAMC28688]
MHLVDITMFYAPEGGGVSTYLNAKAAWLAQRGVHHSILSPNVQGRAGAPALVHLAGAALPGFNGYRMPWTVSGPARALRALQPDLIEAGDAAQAAWAALRVKRQLGIPAVAFYHSDLARLMHERWGGLAGALARRYLAPLYRQFDLVLAPSKRMVAQLAGMGVAGAVHQPLGIDTSTFTPARRMDNLRERLRLPASTRLLVYAGRDTPEKKLPMLHEAVRTLGSPYHLLLVGGAGAHRGPHTSHLPFMRDQAQLACLLASCDLLVHPGDCETFGLIVLEAMACGLPVVAASGGGTAELLDEDTGILVQPNSVAALCAGIDTLFQRDRSAMGLAAARKAREHYDWNHIMPQLMQRYARLLALWPGASVEVERLCASE